MSEPSSRGVGTCCKQTERAVLELGVHKNSKTPAEAPAKRTARDWVNWGVREVESETEKQHQMEQEKTVQAGEEEGRKRLLWKVKRASAYLATWNMQGSCFAYSPPSGRRDLK